MPTPYLFLVPILIWGSTYLVITFQLGEVAPAVSVVYRFAISAVLLFGWAAVSRKRLWTGWRRQPLLCLQGLFNFGLSYVCTYEAEGHLVSALVAVLFTLMVFWNALGARLFFGTQLRWQTLCAALVSICGVVLLFSQPLLRSWQTLDAGHASGFVTGMALAVLATLSASAGNMVAVKVGRAHDNDVLVTSAWAMLWGTLSVAGLALVTGQAWIIPRTSLYWMSVLYLAVCGSVIAFTAYFTLINRVGPGRAAYTTVLTPVVSVLLSMRFEGYQPGAVGFVGMVLCLVGVIWAIVPKDRGAGARVRLPAALDPVRGDHA